MIRSLNAGGRKPFAAPSVFSRITDHAIAGWEAKSAGKIGGRRKLTGVRIALEAVRAFADNVKLVTVPFSHTVEKASPAAVTIPLQELPGIAVLAECVRAAEDAVDVDGLGARRPNSKSGAISDEVGTHWGV